MFRSAFTVALAMVVLFVCADADSSTRGHGRKPSRRNAATYGSKHNPTHRGQAKRAHGYVPSARSQARHNPRVRGAHPQSRATPRGPRLRRAFSVAQRAKNRAEPRPTKARFWGRNLIPTRIPVRFVFGTLQALFYPVAVAGEMAFKGSRGIVRGIRQRKIPWPRFGGLWGRVKKDMAKLLIFTTIAVAANSTSINYSTFDRQTSPAAAATLHEDAETSNTIVVVQGFEQNDRLAPTVLRRYQRLKAEHDNVHMVEGENEWEVLAQLKDIADKHGEIQRLDIYGHGAPGTIKIRNSSVIPNSLVHLQDRQNFPRSDFGARTAHKAPPLRLKNVMARGAQIRLFNCQAGCGVQGEAVMRTIGEALLDKGGSVHAARTDQHNDLGDGLTVSLPDWANRPIRFGFSAVHLSRTVLGPLTDSENHFADIGVSFQGPREVTVAPRAD